MFITDRRGLAFGQPKWKRAWTCHYASSRSSTPTRRCACGHPEQVATQPPAARTYRDDTAPGQSGQGGKSLRWQRLAFCCQLDLFKSRNIKVQDYTFPEGLNAWFPYCPFQWRACAWWSCFASSLRVRREEWRTASWSSPSRTQNASGSEHRPITRCPFRITVTPKSLSRICLRSTFTHNVLLERWRQQGEPVSRESDDGYRRLARSCVCKKSFPSASKTCPWS